jgi:putative membrane protein
LFINALLFMLVGELVTGFSVDTFWHAMGGALIVSLTNMVISLLIGKPRPAVGVARPPARPKTKPTDVIDI